MSDTEKQPNLLIIVADDLGYSDVGCFGGEIHTPNIDRLAGFKESLRFTQFYAAAACSPTRSMLMSGTDNHIAGVGQMWEAIRRVDLFKERPGYEGYLNNRVAALPEILNANGYETFMAGKWHLGLTPDTSPHARGFERSFSMLPGAANHYGWEPQLSNKEKPGFFHSAEVVLNAEDGKYVKNLPKDYYSSDFYGNRLVEYLQTRDRKRPFFGYLPFTAPHWPLQAPQEIIKKYRGFYDDGPDALREKRLKRLVELGLLTRADITPHDVVAPNQKPWDQLTEIQRQKSARAMEVFAAMVERMDWNIGLVLQELESQGILDDTLIIFMSDNGAEGAALEAAPILNGMSLVDYVAKYYDNSLDNIGNANSYAWYGPRWAQAATAPSWLYKMFNSEGGIHVPFVLKPPKIGKLKSLADRDFGSSGQAGITHIFTTVMDILPTFLDLAGIEDHNGNFLGRRVAPIRGKSIVPALLSSKTATPGEDKYLIHDTNETIGWELFGNAAVRQGSYKLTYIQQPYGDENWHLFNIDEDPGETKDLKGELPELYQQLLQKWNEYSAGAGVIGLQHEMRALPKPDLELDDDLKWMKYERVVSGVIYEELKNDLIPEKYVKTEAEVVRQR